MSILQYKTQVSPDGYITLPPMPEYRDRKVVVRIEELAMPSLSDDEVEQFKSERLKRKAAEHARIMEQAPEEWQAACEDFMTSWKGCLKGVPHMTTKEIRAERLEKKYGQHGGQE